MANPWMLLWQRLSGRGENVPTEVERIGILQQAAARRRAEYVEKTEQAARLGEASLSSPLSYSRKCMELAEAAHAAALQKWENKQSRQKSY